MEPVFCSAHLNVTIDAKDAKLKHADVVQPTIVTTTIAYSHLDSRRQFLGLHRIRYVGGSALSDRY
jgi:hypothetical protein